MDTTKRINTIYGNWLVLHPQGFEMFRCTTKKAEFYLKNNLANIVLENPPTIKLTFSPAGNGWQGDIFALTQKKNICVVCGTEELDRLTKHHIVPTLYKKHFPKHLKIATSHDVVCICRECHDKYENTYALKLKEKISEQYNVPLWSSHSDFIKIIKLSKAYVLNNSMMPDERKLELIMKISLMLGYENDFAPIEEIEKLSKISQKDYNELHSSHGKEVIAKVTDIQKFVEMWRLDFVDSMKPKFMPQYWDVYRVIDRPRKALKIK
jgi:hypothetical protein